jgi:hypothetical protein
MMEWGVLKYFPKDINAFEKINVLAIKGLSGHHHAE